MRRTASVTSITIGQSVTSIGSYVCHACSSLTSIYYGGTAKSWNAIKIEVNQDELMKATRYYYSETEPALNAEGTAYNGNFWHYVDGEIVVWVKES